SNYLYINPHKGMLTDANNRKAVLQAVNVDELVKQTYFGRGEVVGDHVRRVQLRRHLATQSVTHDPSVLAGIAGGLPADQKAVTIGYDSSNPDNQLI
ncbi:ABC transporter substrate-binding protein, partial [Mycobacterium sp. ITM-2017-0098]